uniref:PCI domain-containing protein n=1 Tax=Entomoneis paludosa TaxID=265537 RepID=A0A7S2YCU8_9STRA|mmetsp:Transcript_27410/g.57400  ORF Transcript_27410/g.57400 Transcript_27410/m.57400 type:complete len:408 (+) Transcript_27410:114-1337(+)
MNRGAKREQFRASLSSQDPYHVASLLTLAPPPPKKNKSKPNDINLPQSSESSIQDSLGNEWSSVIKSWLDTQELSQAGLAVRAYESQSQLHASFNQMFGSSTGNWLVPALHAVCKSTHRLAKAADKELGGGASTDQAKLQSAVNLLQESFSRTYNDRKEYHPNSPFGPEGSKKAGVLSIVNELFVIYFSLNTLRLCKNLVRPMEAKKLHEKGTMGELVMYRYYTGRLSLFEDQYADAEQNLEYAFQNCHVNAVKNKRIMLRYLVPVKLYRGRLPSASLLQKYGLTEYGPLVDSMRKGDLRTFNDTLVRFQDKFIRQGTYLLLEKCKAICYRNLFKRIHYVVGKSQIALGHVANSFKGLGVPIDLDEIECILANLIYRGYVRGYLSHTKRVLVLSKRDPFPVSAVMAK